SFALLSVRAQAAESDTSPTVSVPVEVFQDPRFLSAPSVEFYYPRKEKRERKAGWIVVNMMVSPQGKTYEVSVLDSFGGPAFEDAAVKVADLMKWHPATSGGAPIDSSVTVKIVFDQPDTRGVSPSFQSAYHELIKAIGTGDRARVDAALPTLNAQNPYE